MVTENQACVTKTATAEFHYFLTTHEGRGEGEGALCGICPNPQKSIELQFSKNYLTTKDPFLVRIQKIQKFRKIYSPDPEFRKFKTKFFLKYLVVNMCSQMDLL